MAKIRPKPREVRAVQLQIHKIKNCPGCSAEPGHVHVPGCLAEMCSHCGQVRRTCRSDQHDPAFSRWTGIYPGVAECFALGLIKEDGSPDILAFIATGLYKTLFSKPNTQDFNGPLKSPSARS